MVITVKLKEQQVEDLTKIAEERGVSRSAVLRWAADDYIAAFFSPDRHIEVTKSSQNDTAAQQDQEG